MADQRRRTTLGAVVAATAIALVAACGDEGASADPLALASRATGADTAALAMAESNSGAGDLAVSATLPAGPGTAPLLRPESPGADVVAALAAALGLGSGTRELPGGWVAPAGADPSVPSDTARLIVLKDGAGSWTYGTSTQCDLDSAAADAASGCTESAVAAPAPDSPAADAPPPVPAPCVGRGPVEPLDDDALREAAAPILDAVGLASAPTTIEGAGTTDARLVASPRVQDLPTSGIDTNVAAVACSGAVVTDARGVLAKWSPDGDYPVIAAEAGVERLRALPQPLMAELCRVPPDGSGCLTSTRTIVGAEFGFMHDIDLGNASVVLAPAWIYTVRIDTVDPDGGPVEVAAEPATSSLVVSALADSALTTPSAVPVPGGGQGSSDPGVPTDPGSGTGGAGAATAEPGIAPTAAPGVDVPERMGAASP